MKITVLHPEGDPSQDIYPKVLRECLPLDILNKLDIIKNEKGEWTIEVNAPLTIKYKDKLLISSQDLDDIIKQELGGITLGNTSRAMTIKVPSLNDLIINLDDIDNYRVLTTEDLKNVLTNPAPGQTSVKLYIDGYGFSGALQYGDGDNLIGVDGDMGRVEVGNIDNTLILKAMDINEVYLYDGGDNHRVLTDLDLPAVQGRGSSNNLVDAIVQAFKLEDLEFKDITDSINLSWCTFTPIKLHQLIGKLVPGSNKVLTLGSDMKAMLSDDDIALASSKGWRVV